MRSVAINTFIKFLLIFVMMGSYFEDSAHANATYDELLHILSKFYNSNLRDIMNNVDPRQALRARKPKEFEYAIQKYIQNTPLRFYRNNVEYLPAGIDDVYIGDRIRHIAGKPIFLDKDTPIGYNLILPPKDIKINGIIVHIYGGDCIYDRVPSKNINLTFNGGNFTTNEYDSFLKSGYAIAELNTIDLKDLKVAQSMIPKELFNRVQASVHYFFEIIKYRPQVIHSDLKGATFNKIILKGGSFGGTMTVRHAQIYPNTFNGYISTNGELISSNRKSAKNQYYTDSSQSRYQWAQDWLSPYNTLFVEKIADPILIIHNIADQNVSARSSIKFARFAMENGKKVQTYFPDSPEGFFYDDLNYIGHSIPKTVGFDKYMRTIINFIKGVQSNSNHDNLEQKQKRKLNLAHSKSYMGFHLTDFTKKFISDIALNAVPNTKSNTEILKNWDDSWIKLFKKQFKKRCIIESLSNPAYLDAENPLKHDDLSRIEIIMTAHDIIFEGFFNDSESRAKSKRINYSDLKGEIQKVIYYDIMHAQSFLFKYINRITETYDDLNCGGSLAKSRERSMNCNRIESDIKKIDEIQILYNQIKPEEISRDFISFILYYPYVTTLRNLYELINPEVFINKPFLLKLHEKIETESEMEKQIMESLQEQNIELTTVQSVMEGLLIRMLSDDKTLADFLALHTKNNTELWSQLPACSIDNEKLAKTRLLEHIKSIQN